MTIRLQRSINRTNGAFVVCTVALFALYLWFLNVAIPRIVWFGESSNVTKTYNSSRDLQSSFLENGGIVTTLQSGNFRNSVVVFPRFKSANVSGLRSRQLDAWSKWLQDMNYLSIGKYFTHCDDGIQIGEIVSIPSKDSNYGMKFVSFLNMTLAETVTKGKAYVDISYNDIKILRRTYELCRRLKKLMACPIAKGHHRIVSEFNLPFFMLKGKYDLKVRSEDNKGQALGCLIATMVI